MKKSKKLIQNKIYVKKSRLHGYGVFAGKDFRKGEVIEECYFILSKGGDKKLEDFYFDAGRNKYALFTGFGSVYNHTDEPNADYKLNLKRRVAVITAERSIHKGEEIYVSYGEEWFKCRGLKPKKKSRN